MLPLRLAATPTSSLCNVLSSEDIFSSFSVQFVAAQLSLQSHPTGCRYGATRLLRKWPQKKPMHQKPRLPDATNMFVHYSSMKLSHAAYVRLGSRKGCESKTVSPKMLGAQCAGYTNLRYLAKECNIGLAQVARIVA